MSADQPELPADYLSLLYAVAMTPEQYREWAKAQGVQR